MNKVNDSEATYAVGRNTAVLAELIGDILGCPTAGQRLMESLVLPEDEATNQNIKARLRLALSSSRIPGVTVKQAYKLKAIWTLIEQLYCPELPVGKVVDDPSIVAEACQPISWQPVEQFMVLSLDCKHQLLSRSIISSGTATETLAYPRDVFSAVLRAGGTRCIVAHNHPSGSLEASDEDLVLTNRLIACGKSLAVPLLDHLIVYQGSFASIRQTYDLWTAE